MNNVLERYYRLILKEKNYLKEYITNNSIEDNLYEQLKKQMIELPIWRAITNYEELESIVHSERAFELLCFNDYYSDEMLELLEKYLNIDVKKISEEEFEKLILDDNLKRIVNDKSSPKRLKDCIILEMESEKVCDEMEKYIKQERIKEHAK